VCGPLLIVGVGLTVPAIIDTKNEGISFVE